MSKDTVGFSAVQWEVLIFWHEATVSLEGVANFTVLLKENVYNGRSTDISYV